MKSLHTLTAAPSPERRLFCRRLLFIALAAFALRLWVSAELAGMNGGANSVCTPSSATDMATYLRLADEIRTGAFALPFYYQPFYYAVFLPMIRLVSASPWLLIVIQSLLGAGAGYLAGLAAAHLYCRRAGLWTAAFCAVSAPLLLYTPFAMNETLQSFHFALLLLLVLLLLKKDSLKLALAAGAVWGIACLTRGNALLFGIILLILMIRKKTWKTGAAVLGMCLLVQLPFAAMNTFHLKHFCGPSTAADAVLALGNTPEAPPGGRNTGLPAGPMEYPETYSDFMERSRTGESVPRQMLAFLGREPGAFLELQFRKVLLFWTGGEIPNNVSLYGEGQYSAVLRTDLIGRSAVLLPFALAGMLVFLPRWRQNRWLWLYGMVVIYWGATALFYDLSRFRAPILPAAFIFAGCFTTRAWRIFQAKKPVLTPVVLPLVCGIFLVNGAYDLYRQNAEAPLQRLFRPDGIVYLKMDGGTLQLDYGPYSFGGWDTLALKPGMQLIKSFAGMQSEKVTLKWQFLLPPGGTVAGTLNDLPFMLNSPGVQVLTMPVTLNSGRAELRIEEASPESAALFDRQRQYGRSFAGKETLSGEFIARINYRRTTE